MKKELIIVIVVGLTIGLIVAFGMRLAKESIDKTNTAPTPAPLIASGSASILLSPSLLITAPYPDEIVTDKIIEVVGTTNAKAMVAITSGESISMKMADNDGAFSSELMLVKGPNLVEISSFSENGEENKVSLKVVLVDADWEGVSTVAAVLATPTIKNASDSAEVDAAIIKENIKKRIQDVVKNQALVKKRTVYMGNLSAVTMSALVIDTQDGVKQASTSATTDWIELPKNKPVTINDIAIGDYLAVLGYLSDTAKVLDTKRVLVLKTPIATPAYKIMLGKIDKIDAKNDLLKLVCLGCDKAEDFLFSNKSLILISDGVYQNKMPLKELEVNQLVLISYDLGEEKDSGHVINMMLVKSDLSLLPTPKPTPTLKPSPTPK